MRLRGGDAVEAIHRVGQEDGNGDLSLSMDTLYLPASHYSSSTLVAARLSVCVNRAEGRRCSSALRRGVSKFNKLTALCGVPPIGQTYA